MADYIDIEITQFDSEPMIMLTTEGTDGDVRGAAEAGRFIERPDGTSFVRIQRDAIGRL